MLLTIFTPAYNRAYTLGKLYESLLVQTCNDFEWLIVDDGSSDETEEIVSGFMEFQDSGSVPFEIRYFKQENGGKHRAINRGLKEAHGELFFIVDSDDFLTADAVEWIKNEYGAIKDLDQIAGLSGIRITPDGNKIGGDGDFGTIEASALEIREKYDIRGDLAELFKTNVFRDFPFPEFAGEKFCPEALVWNRIAQRYQLRYVYKGIYVCDYLPDGLTAIITKIRHRSPIASMTYYSELFGYEHSLRLKMRAAINFWRFAEFRLFGMVSKFKMWNNISLLVCPLGLFVKFVDIIHKQV